MTLQSIEFRNEMLAITAMMAVPVPPVPGVDYSFRANPDTGFFEPTASTTTGGPPAEEFLIGGKQWNILNHTLMTDRVQAIITLAEPVEYASADGTITGAFYPKYEPINHGIVQGAEMKSYIVDLGSNFPPADSIYVLLFAVGMQGTSMDSLMLSITPQPARTGNQYTITITGAEPGEEVTVNWDATTVGGAASYTFTANNQGEVLNTDTVGSADSPIGNYSGTISSASGKTGTFSYTLG